MGLSWLMRWLLQTWLGSRPVATDPQRRVSLGIAASSPLMSVAGALNVIPGQPTDKGQEQDQDQEPSLASALGWMAFLTALCCVRQAIPRFQPQYFLICCVCNLHLHDMQNLRGAKQRLVTTGERKPALTAGQGVKKNLQLLKVYGLSMQQMRTNHYYTIWRT